LAACQVRIGEKATPPGAEPKADHGPVAEENVIVEIAAGSRHTCARRKRGDVICWGTNDHGQLGDGGTKSRGNPVAIEGLGEVVEIVAGERHSCARLEDGKVLCWGSNEHGQVGDGSGRPGAIRKTPAPVRGLEDAVSIESGARHVCAIRKAGSVLCWGDNRKGQLGNRGRKVWVAPVFVKDAAGAAKIAAGAAHTCALRKSGTIDCWGSNADGQLGDGTTRGRVQGRPVRDVRDAIDLVAGGSQTCARHKGGKVTCWGAGATKPLRRPTTVLGLQGTQQLSVGDKHVCARIEGGKVLCWGENDDGRLGDGSTEARGKPTRVRRLADATQVVAGVRPGGLLGQQCRRGARRRHPRPQASIEPGCSAWSGGRAPGERRRGLHLCPPRRRACPVLGGEHRRSARRRLQGRSHRGGRGPGARRCKGAGRR
jgi:alpha-tubulin suppressor-like RCC1 family protein